MVMETKENHTGDCFEVHGRFMLEMMYLGGGKGYKLVHGMVHGNGKLNGYKYAHCWIEINGQVLDMSNGSLINTSVENYYGLGKISDVHKYSLDDVISKILEHGHWGCWDFVGDVEKV